MSPTEAVEHFYSALDAVNCIDLRGRRAGTPLHTAVHHAKNSLEEAIALLTEEAVA